MSEERITPEEFLAAAEEFLHSERFADLAQWADDLEAAGRTIRDLEREVDRLDRENAKLRGQLETQRNTWISWHREAEVQTARALKAEAALAAVTEGAAG